MVAELAAFPFFNSSDRTNQLSQIRNHLGADFWDHLRIFFLRGDVSSSTGRVLSHRNELVRYGAALGHRNIVRLRSEFSAGEHLSQRRTAPLSVSARLPCRHFAKTGMGPLA